MADLEIIKNLKNNNKKKNPIITFFQIIGVVVLLSFSFYHLAYANKTLPGVFIGDIDFSGLGEQEVDAKLDKMEQMVGSTWVLMVGSNSFKVKADDLGLVFQKQETKDRLFNAGRQKNLLRSFKDKFYALTVGLEVMPIYDIDNKLLTNYIDTLVIESSLQYQDAIFILGNEEELLLVGDEKGYTVDKSEIVKTINNYYFKFRLSSEPVSGEIINSVIVTPDLEGYFDTISQFLDSDFTIKYENLTFTPTKKEKLSFVSIDAKNKELVVDVHENEYLKAIINQINRPITTEVLQIEEEKVISFTPAKNGLKVDEDAFSKDLIGAIFNEDTARIVNVPVVISEAEKRANEYGINELVGSGDTTYFHSALNRVFNVNLAANRVTNVLVPPNSEFSFNEVVGEVSASTGYKQAYIIYNNKTILGDGGGLCQVSTTLYRAILDAGLPVVNRVGHAYRVGYYEQNSGPGLDATVFVPSVDLKFFNDTGHYLLIVSESIPEEYYLKYSIYGTNDGRKVTLTEPVIKSQTAPPDPIYQDDPTLSKGVIKQVEWASWGAVVEYSRTVERDGEVVYEDIFKTNYKPWAAAYLVGTK